VSFSTHVEAGMMNPSDFSGYKGFKRKGALEGDSAHRAGPLSKAEHGTRKVRIMRMIKAFGLLPIALVLLAIPAASQAQIAVGVSI
jgi:hypothetical protein